MLVDNFNRKIDYLRISVTDRCNLRCIYCMPQYGIINKSHDQVLTFEEIVRIVKIVSCLGITKIRLTGGEPLVRKGILNLVRSISKIKQIEDLSMTTNGILLRYYAEPLRNSGLKRLNISLDSLDENKYASVTGCGSLRIVKEGITKAIESGFSLIKINVLLLKGINENEIVDFLKLTKQLPIHIRFLEFMPADPNLSSRVCGFSCERVMEKAYQLGPIEEVNLYGHGPVKNFRFKDTEGSFGIITAMSEKFCYKCNRLRLTSDGFIISCLHSELKINLRNSLRSGIDDAGLIQLIKQAVYIKPKEHLLDKGIRKFSEHSMCQIGG